MKITTREDNNMAQQISVEDVFDYVVDRLNVLGRFYELDGLTSLPVSFSESRFAFHARPLPIPFTVFLKEWVGSFGRHGPLYG